MGKVYVACSIYVYGIWNVECSTASRSTLSLSLSLSLSISLYLSLSLSLSLSRSLSLALSLSHSLSIPELLPDILISRIPPEKQLQTSALSSIRGLGFDRNLTFEKDRRKIEERQKKNRKQIVTIVHSWYSTFDRKLTFEKDRRTKEERWKRKIQEGYKKDRREKEERKKKERKKERKKKKDLDQPATVDISWQEGVQTERWG